MALTAQRFDKCLVICLLIVQTYNQILFTELEYSYYVTMHI